MRKFWEKLTGSAGLRLALRSGIRQFALVLAIGLFIKFFVFDSFKITGAQMEPAINSLDRILLFKTPYLAPFIKNSSARAGKPVVAAVPDRSVNTVLRIAALSGDTVQIENGQLYVNGDPAEGYAKDTETYNIIPAEYSPADFMESFIIPAPGDSVALGELPQRDLVFVYSMLRQEKKSIRLKACVIKNGKANSEYRIKDFALYSGRLDSIPEELSADWFFWDRLQGYLEMAAGAEDSKPLLALSILKGGKEITGFKVKNRYVFLMGDNWNSAKDSRYFGPVASTNIKGRPLLAIWGFSINDEGKQRFDFKRVLRLVR